jgi:hypothetical protein
MKWIVEPLKGICFWTTTCYYLAKLSKYRWAIWYASLKFSTLYNTLLKFARFKKIVRNYTFCILHECKKAKKIMILHFIFSLYLLIVVLRPERSKNLKFLLLIYS